MRARGGDLAVKSISSVGGLIEYYLLPLGVGTFDYSGTENTQCLRFAKTGEAGSTKNIGGFQSRVKTAMLFGAQNNSKLWLMFCIIT